jgi:hypothetical protein
MSPTHFVGLTNIFLMEGKYGKYEKCEGNKCPTGTNNPFLEEFKRKTI